VIERVKARRKGGRKSREFFNCTLDPSIKGSNVQLKKACMNERERQRERERERAVREGEGDRGGGR